MDNSAKLRPFYIAKILFEQPQEKHFSIFLWYDQLGGDSSPLADAIIDRLAHNGYRINITSIDFEHDISIREVYGLAQNLRE